MTESQRNAELNTLLIDLSRGLLQYVSDASPWTSGEAASLGQQIDSLIARQGKLVEQLAQLLLQRDWPVDFGVYPQNFTGLHFVSIEYLLGRIVQDADRLVQAIEEARDLCRDDSAAARLLAGIATEQAAVAAELRNLTVTRETAGSPAAE